MSDLAELGLRIRSEDADLASTRLDKMTGGAQRAERATDLLGGSSDKAGGAIAGMLASIERSVSEMADLMRIQQQLSGATLGQVAAIEDLAKAYGGATGAEAAFLATMETEAEQHARLDAMVKKSIESYGEQRRAIDDVTEAQGRMAAGGSGGWGGVSIDDLVKDSAKVKEVAEDTARLDAEAEKLRRTLDPLYAAQAKYDDEIDRAHHLFSKGAISQSTLNQAIAKSEGQLDRATRAHIEHAKAVRNSRTDMRLMRSSIFDVISSVRSGQNPLEIMARQGSNIGINFGGQGGAAAGLRAFAGAAGAALIPMAGLIAAGAAVAGVAVLWARGEKTALGYERAVSGVGRTAGLTAEQLRALTVAGAEQGGISIKAAQEQSAAYMATGRIGAESMGTLLRIGKDYASFIGSDATTATRSLAGAMEDPLKAAKDMTRQFGLLTQEQIKQIEKAMKQGDQMKAQKILLGELDKAVESHAAKTSEITNAWDAVTRSISNAITKAGEFLYVTDAEKLAKMDARLEVFAPFGPQERSPKWVRDLQSERDSLANTLFDRQKRQAEAAAAAAANQQAQIVEDNKKKPKGPTSDERREASLARELSAMRATTKANYDLAQAYGVSEAAALRATATSEAVGKAVKRQGDIDSFVTAQLELNASKLASSAAQQAADLRFSAEAQERMNALAAAGAITTEEAVQAMALEAQLRPLIAAAAVVEGDAKAALLRQIDGVTEATARMSKATRESSLIQAEVSSRDRLEVLRLERDLIGANNVERTRQLAMLEEEIRLRNQYGKAFVNSSRGQAMIGQVGVSAAYGAETQRDIARYNLALTEQLDLLRHIDDHARSAGQGMADAFGEAGRAMGEMAASLTQYRARLEEIAVAKRQMARDGMLNSAREAMFTRDAAQAHVMAYGDMAGAAKSFFREGSDGYRILHAAEQGYRLFQFAMSVQAMAMGSTETAASVAQSATRGAASMAAGAAKMFEFLGPLGFPAVAAMLGLLAGLGLKGKGGGGGRGYSAANDDIGASVETARSQTEQQERAQDASAQSVAAKVQVMVEFNDPMFRARVQKETGPMIATAAASAAGYAKQDTMKALVDQQRGNRKAVT